MLISGIRTLPRIQKSACVASLSAVRTQSLAILARLRRVSQVASIGRGHEPCIREVATKQAIRLEKGRVTQASIEGDQITLSWPYLTVDLSRSPEREWDRLPSAEQWNEDLRIEFNKASTTSIIADSHLGMVVSTCLLCRDIHGKGEG